MSTRKGSGESRVRPQKHQNTHVWKFDKNKTDPKTKILQNIVVTNCCEKCTGVIEWKIKYGKYKPLTQPTRCVKCSEKRVKSAYHQLCSKCVAETGSCAKCGLKEAEVVHKPEPNAVEAARLEAELQKELKALPERKRRTFMRYLQQQQKRLNSKVVAAKEDPAGSQDEQDGPEDPEPEAPRSLHQVHLDCFEKLKSLTEKYGKSKMDNLDDFDLEDLDDLDLSDESDDDDDDEDD